MMSRVGSNLEYIERGEGRGFAAGGGRENNSAAALNRAFAFRRSQGAMMVGGIGRRPSRPQIDRGTDLSEDAPGTGGAASAQGLPSEGATTGPTLTKWMVVKELGISLLNIWTLDT